MSRFAGMPVVVSEHATKEWQPPEPRTDDMRAMVDEFWRRGVILPRRVPTAYKMLDHLVVHPTIYATIQRYSQTIRPQTVVDYRGIVS